MLTIENQNAEMQNSKFENFLNRRPEKLLQSSYVLLRIGDVGFTSLHAHNGTVTIFSREAFTRLIYIELYTKLTSDIENVYIYSKSIDNVINAY